MSELSKRVATAVVLVPLVLGAVLWLPTGGFAVAFGALAVLGAWEWAGLMGWIRTHQRVAYGAGVALLLTAMFELDADWPVLGPAVLVAAVAWWGVALAWVVRYEQGLPVEALAAAPVRTLAGWLVLVPTWVALVSLHGSGPGGPSMVLALLLVVWAADIGAYFAGRRFGRRRLAPRVSPGKSWEGVAGGLGAVAALGVAFGVALGMVYSRVLVFAALCVLSAAVSVLGDLGESLFKRRAGMKDSGALFPGHGGVLDRIDSITAAAPVFVLGLAAMGDGH